MRFAPRFRPEDGDEFFQTAQPGLVPAAAPGTLLSVRARGLHHALRDAISFTWGVGTHGACPTLREFDPCCGTARISVGLGRRFYSWASPGGRLCAQDVPAPGGGAEPDRGTGDGGGCGFVQTTWGDPGWIIATSDHILRANLCMASAPCAATHWYDRVQMAPCYADTRLWKLAPSKVSASAFPMAGIGIGTFDAVHP